MGTSEEIKAEYTSSLADLTTNSKPLINVLTMLAEEYGKEHAKEIVEAIETHLSKVSTEVKLPILYLIDSIVKNVDNTYTELFSQNIVSTFCNVFKLVDESTRSEMFKLRQTWNDVFPQNKLYAIDVQIRHYDPAWPVTAQPMRPSTANPTGKNSIYFNPRFLKNSNNAGKPSGTLDAETLKMQEKLIQKQKELIELQQKKLELEVLQTQVKLREQISNGKSAPIINPNLLLKPNVMATLTNENTKTKPTINMTLMNQRAANAPRINPVSSALVSATAKKPTVRDPRLLRQQQQLEHLRHQQQHQDQHNQQFHQKNTPSNVQLGHKPIESNKVVVTTNKRVRDIERGEPQRPLIINNNKDKDENIHSLSHTSNISNSSNKKSPRSNQDKHSSSSSSKSKRSDTDRFDSKSGSSKSSSTSSLDSPSKIKSDKSSPKSPSKYKINKKDNKQNNDDNGNKKTKHYIGGNSSGNNSGTSTAKHKNEANMPLATAAGAASFPSSFKSVKNSKNRNYVRRNLSKSPETVQDEDLRATYGPPDKVPRLMEDESKKDIDLRVIPSTGKKRQSSDNQDPSATKKSKTEVFDVLFGDQDTDLRQLAKPPLPDRPPTPPPPIISSSDSEPSQKKPNSDFDAIRAKLANATNRDKIMSKSFNKKRMTSEERVSSTTSDISDKIIITADDEKCIKSGTLSKEKEQQLLNQIIMQVERNKLREAKLKEKESTKSSNVQQIDDSSSEDSSSSDEERYRKSTHHSHDKFQRGTNNTRGKWRSGPRRNRFEPIPPTPTMPGIPPIRGAPRIGPWMQPPPMQKPWRQMGQTMSPWIAAQAHQATYDDENVGRKSPDVNDKLVVDSVNQDDIKTIQIDSIPREIRYYDDTAVIFMSWDDPREISFQNGTRRIIFNDHDTYLLGFNEPDKDVMVNGNLVRVRLGAPTREVFVNGKPYECYFGGPGIPIEINGQKLHLMLEGPPPQVKIGTEKRTDLVAGKVNLIINAKIIVPVYLDAKLQKFIVDGETVTLKFVDALKTVLINNVPFVVEFGGLPKPITIHNKKHFIRFSVLPKGIKPGNVNIKDMDSCISTSCNNAGKTDNEVSDEARLKINNDNNSADNETVDTNSINNAAGVNDSSLPSTITGNAALDANKTVGNESPERNSNSPSFFQNLLQHQNISNLDVLSNAITNVAVNTPSTSGYQVASASQSIHDQSSNPLPDMTSSQSNQLSNILPPTLNINDLFQKLVSTGILTSAITPASSSSETKETVHPPSTTVSALESLPVAPPISSIPITISHNPPIVSSIHHNISSISAAPVVPSSLIHSTVPIGPRIPLHLQDNFQTLDSKPRKNIFENLKPITFQRPETLKVRQSALYLALYSGMQCSSCGMRFPPEQSMHYSQHLDWHFRQNRKGKKNIRVAASRKWYYSMTDWKNYEEIEDLEEREKNYFDQQMTQNEANADDESEDLEEPSVPADPDVTDERCEVCQDVLEQFFNEEKEEWHLRNAIRIDEKTYHPVCYEDYQKALQAANDDSKIENEETSEDVQSVNKDELIPGLEIILDDDDDDEIEEKTNDEVIEMPKNKEPTEESTKEADKEESDSEDDDVIINEVAPVRIVVDDDDDDDADNMEHNNSDTGEKEMSNSIPKSSTTEMDDGFVDVSIINFKNGGTVRIKPEPLDEDEMEDGEGDLAVNNEENVNDSNEEVRTEELTETLSTASLDIPEIPEAIASNPLELVSSIDGNVLESGTVVPPSTSASIAGKIKINISKPLPTMPTRDSNVSEAGKTGEGDEEEPTTLEESEPPMPKHIKPALEGLELKKMPPVQKGSELTGMCSIM